MSRNLIDRGRKATKIRVSIDGNGTLIALSTPFGDILTPNLRIDDAAAHSKS